MAQTCNTKSCQIQTQTSTSQTYHPKSYLKRVENYMQIFNAFTGPDYQFIQQYKDFHIYYSFLDNSFIVALFDPDNYQFWEFNSFNEALIACNKLGGYDMVIA